MVIKMKSRLLKVILAEEFGTESLDHQMTLTNNPASIAPYGIVFRGAEEKVSDDPITKSHHSADISREFTFEKDINNPEWNLRNGKKK